MGHGSAAPAAEAGPSGPALDTYAKTGGNRLRRWEARGFLWDYSDLRRVRDCGRFPHRSDGLVGVRADGRAVGYSGLMSCGSVWACPCCNHRIQAVRALEVGVALSAIRAAGMGAGFGALTVRHHQGQSLGALLDGLSAGQKRIPQDKRVRVLRERLGYVGQVQALEVTHGRNGWHPHRHPLPVFARPVSADALADLHLAQARAFRRGVEARGLDAPLDVAQVLRPVEDWDGPLDGYLSKSTFTGSESLAWEVTSSQGKSARRKGRTPWALLHDARAGDADALMLWNEYEAASRGKRALVWSRGLRDRLSLGDEATDDDIAAAEVGSVEDQGFSVTDWEPVRRRPQHGAGLLNAITPAGDWAAGRRYAAAHGIPIQENP